jgi:hypothetical protein
MARFVFLSKGQLMKTRVFVALFVLLMASPAYAGSNWTFNVFGITSKDIESRSITKVIIGMASSYVVHECGHLLFGRLAGMNTSMRWENGGPEAYAKGYYGASNDRRALYNGGGFLAQLIVGTALTVIPATRHSDFSVGFTGWTTINNWGYAIANGTRGSNSSDTANLTRDGYPGRVVAFVTGSIGATELYINLKKEDKHRR